MKPGLSITGTALLSVTNRAAPLDPKSHQPQVGAQQAAVTMGNKHHFDQTMFVKKERTNFGGGFKIPDEYRVKRETAKNKKLDASRIDDDDNPKDTSLVTKDEILTVLNLGSSESGLLGKSGEGSKTAITKDLCEGLEKDLKKLKMTEENIRNRQIAARPGGAELLAETEQDRENIRIANLQEQVIWEGAHIVSADEKRLQLFRHKAGQLDSLKDLNLDDLEALRTAQEKRLRELEEILFSGNENSKIGQELRKRMIKEKSNARFLAEEAEAKRDQDPTEVKSQQKSQGSDQKQPAKAAAKPRQRTKSVSPRRVTFNAKFQKYRTNKTQKLQDEGKQKVKQDFDFITKNAFSPSRRAQNYRSNEQHQSQELSEGSEQHLVRLPSPTKDAFNQLGVSQQDKMAFFLLKWVFNATKKGMVVAKQSILTQLRQNSELLAALSLSSVEQLESDLRAFGDKEELSWHEYLQFFFDREGESASGWWLKLDRQGKPVQEEVERPGSQKQRVVEFQEVLMTPQLELLLSQRRVRTEQEVEEEYLKQNGKFTKQEPEPIPDTKLKSKSLLLPSQIQALQDCFIQMDHYKDDILKRLDFVTALRTNEQVVDFITEDAVKTVYGKVLTFEQVLTEIERDQMYEQMQDKTQESINHKEFITWKEFISYFEDFKDVQDRYRKSIKLKQVRQDLNQDSQLQQLIDRRISELPSLRKEDMIDIQTEQLQLVKDIFDQEKTGDQCQSSFFVALRKDKKIRVLLSAICRDPDGCSRVPRETFKECFDRMESELHGKPFGFHTVIEYFTKRGRPMTKQEQQTLHEQEQEQQELVVEKTPETGECSDESEDKVGCGLQPRCQSAKAVSHKLTIPQPFEFDSRDKTKSKSIREQKIEQMIEQSKPKKQVFRCKPIPSQVLQPRYYQIMQQNERRRQKIKQQSLLMTQETENPFSFWERDKVKQLSKAQSQPLINVECQRQAFKANPIPKVCSVLIYTQNLVRQEQERKKRVHEQAEISYSKARMPSRMQKDSDRQKSQPKKDPTADLYPFKPKIGEAVTGEMFKAMQRKFEEKLNRKKSQMAVTKPQSPNFTKSKSRPLERDYVNEAQPQPDKYQTLQPKRPSDKPVKQPSSTRAMELSQAKRRQDIVAKLQLEKAKQKEDEQRKKKQERLKPELQGLLGSIVQSGQEKIKQQAESNKAQHSKQEQEIKKIIEMAVEAGRDRPMLLNSYDQKKVIEHQREIQTVERLITVLVESGLSLAQAETHLTAEERVLYEEGKRLQDRKKQDRADKMLK